MSGPRVFADGTMTVVIGPEPWPETVQVYVGTHKIKKLQALRFEAGAAHPTAGEITLPPRTGKEETDLENETEARLLSALKWLRIRRD